jgi:uncharacterized protein
MIRKLTSEILIFFVRLYKAGFSYWLGGRCRFVPSCSEYAIMAIEELGPVKGSLKTIYRVLRCNPLCKGGVDLPTAEESGNG